MLYEQTYEKVQHFKYADLHKQQKKVVVQLDIVEKEKGIFYAEKIISVHKTDGVSKINGSSMTFMRN